MSIPEKLSAESAAPLMCGGITVSTPFRVFDVRPGMEVGVIGIGGLGHLGLQFASTLGFEVTAFSSSSLSRPSCLSMTGAAEERR